ncbi:MAG: universal stress protein [Burkholderiaceae bacterium]|nr:universal stress protein [Burkholderiaceae bacterium]
MYKSILVPIDGSEPSDYGLVHAIGLARDHKATLHILHAIDAYPLMVEVSSVQNVEQMRRDLLKYGEGLLEKARRQAADQGIQVETRLKEIVTGRVSDVILDEARKASCDLIVMGTHGRRGISRMVLGSDAESVTRSSTVPVLLVPHRPK